MIDGQQIGVTSSISPDPGVWCALVPAAKDTCAAKGLSKGRFTIPAGPHTVQIVNVIGVSNDPKAVSYSTMFYQLERQCTPGIPPLPSCTAALIKDWTNVDVYNANPYQFNFNYGNPIKLTVMDAGYRTEKVTYLVSSYNSMLIFTPYTSYSTPSP